MQEDELLMESTYIFFRWLLTGISLPDYRRRLSKRKNEEEDGPNEEERSTKIKTRRNFNIQIIRTSSFIHEQSDDVEPKNEEEGEIPAKSNGRCSFQGTSKIFIRLSLLDFYINFLFLSTKTMQMLLVTDAKVRKY